MKGRNFYEKKKKILDQRRLRSFKYAANGLKVLATKEHNARIHVIAAILAILGATALKSDVTEWIAVLIVIALVFITEMLNSAVERLCDYVKPEYSHILKLTYEL
ncbi:MAG: diacylglycerol kinase family protein [Prevotella sp.]